MLAALLVTFLVLVSKNHVVANKEVVNHDKKHDQANLEPVSRTLRERKQGRSGSSTNPHLAALQAWSAYLNPDRDYNSTRWREMYRSSTWSVHFNGYCRHLSEVFKERGAKVNFVMIGACDGTNDVTIRTHYLPNEHWRGIFVEPFAMNVRDLIQNLAFKNATSRSMVLQAAATEVCAGPTLTLERPLYEEKMAAGNSSKPIPHWLRRQIGSILPTHREHARKEWTLEEVRCVTGDIILDEWCKTSGRQKKSMKSRRRRPHVLKIDVEGHDYEVLMSFLKPSTPDRELPLLIDFEAKSIAKKYPAAVKTMEERGYVVSPYGADGFALLKAEVILSALYSKPKDTP